MSAECRGVDGKKERPLQVKRAFLSLRRRRSLPRASTLSLLEASLSSRTSASLQLTSKKANSPLADEENGVRYPTFAVNEGRFCPLQSLCNEEEDGLCKLVPLTLCTSPSLSLQSHVRHGRGRDGRGSGYFWASATDWAVGTCGCGSEVRGLPYITSI